MNELDGKALVRADLATGIVIALIGLAVVVLSAGMPTFVERGVNPLTAPGIFPAIVGAVLLLCGTVLTIRSVRGGQGLSGEAAFTVSGVRAVAGTLVLMLVAVALVGRIDFWMVSGGFTLAFSAIFLDWRVSGEALYARLAAVALTVAITAYAIPTLFERVFLVRLP